MSHTRLKVRRLVALLVSVITVCVIIIAHDDMWQQQTIAPPPASSETTPAGSAAALLRTLPVKGKAPKTGYERTQFGSGWAVENGCDTRNMILARDMTDVVASEDCKVLSGVLNDPYTGQTIHFQRGAGTSDAVQVDHVVALSNAWQTGAQQLTLQRRQQLANDPLELIAVDGTANQQKSDGDAATWLPAYKPFRCQYIARQIAVKAKYELWVTPAEHDAMVRVLASCPGQALPTE